MADDGRHRSRTPPRGVRPPARAPSVPDTFEDLTPPPTEPPEDPAHALTRIGRRVRLTAENSQATLDRVDDLRRDLEARFARVESRIVQLVDGVASAREAGAMNTGKLDALMDVLDAERQSRAQYEAAAAAALAATTEVTRSRALSQIEAEASDRAAERTERTESTRHSREVTTERVRAHREIVLRIFAGIAAVWAALSAYLLAR